ncbi:glycosyltransferase family 2 protein [Roseomonas sp. SSH11]|uniref:Glycosyltransferase family 2 protein n=1 Tax=Pararoseomonas baculiformis TaxID=2820812 RepID=A0ABS4ABQ9_9PROT|nr:glycosyltransferase family 2 protein [Pararoseomonas baculiformis]MBP0443933.1 glycosyltransferase family 2 protein [Pararoseomonas baculiformis]
MNHARSPLPRVTVVTVTHNSAAALRGMLEALPAGLAAIIVDNASTDDGPELAEAAGARVIRSLRNLGFGAGCNLGLEAALTEFALVLNPDARIDETALAALAEAADLFPEAAIFAPVQMGGDGRPHRSWNAAQPRRRQFGGKRDAEPWPEGPFCADYVQGAALLLRREDRLRFDESFFLFYEDDDLCAQARRMGRSVVLVPAAVITHAGGRSSRPSPGLHWRKARHMAFSRLHFASKHEGQGAAARQARARLAHHACKALGHTLTLRHRKLWTDLAGLAGTIGWIIRRR